MFPDRNEFSIHRPAIGASGKLRPIAPARATRLNSAPAVYSDPRVTKGTADLWVFMFEHYPSSKAEGRCWPSVEGLSRDAGVPERTVQRRLGRLSKFGWLTITARKQRVDGKQGTNVYTFCRPSAIDQKADWNEDCDGCQSGVTGRVSNDTPIDTPNDTRAFLSEKEASLREEQPYGKDAGGGVSPSNPEKQRLIDRWPEFLEQWPEHNRRGVDLGCQTWLSHIDSGVINAANVHEVFEGLKRWKNSAQWQKNGGQFIPTIAHWEGKGWLQLRTWKDLPPQRHEGDEW